MIEDQKGSIKVDLVLMKLKQLPMEKKPTNQTFASMNIHYTVVLDNFKKIEFIKNQQR